MRSYPAAAAGLMALMMLMPGQAEAAEAKAVFAGGCFWCVESDFDHVPGVLATISGYIGGSGETATYKQVSAGGTGHYEAVEITYDPAVVSYETLVHTFFRTVDPLDPSGQFCDRGESYRTAIFAAGKKDRAVAEAEKAVAEKTLGKKVATPILPAATFYPAEDYHQDYYLKNPIRYKYYRTRCGRDQRVRAIWGDEARKAIPAG
ncbi:peptide-methionine (S)-S-oxide reductase MsrA [Methylobrevis pamukkalensis]|uniref:Peptide methionine sulfoxide reductase MsrA n=1 Tax=Methylobrevis pamukkalensis TaxID=1439726 RepID=A0A1E3GYB2_9HYPH|nr:peptide-methionine (S)-S-oxide reductase MsrA [Methylobrevis pamukkalensis]ODN69014.1 Peptide methionine sulfoxide reductase MsrA 2 [Methylobrevis pamukkalensis]